MLKFLATTAVLTVLRIGPGSAAPPPAGSEQDELLLPHGAWVRGLMNPVTKQGCCDLSDCRVVAARIRFGHYQAFIGRDAYGEDAPEGWLDVPDEVVLHGGDNPVGLPVACWRASRQPLLNGFFCFHDGSAT
jgi:hypothetical protein